MKKSLLVMAIAALATVVGINTVFAGGKRDRVVCKLVGEKRVVCPKKKLRGKRGKQGEQGRVGPAGGGTPVDTESQPLRYAMPANSPTETVAVLDGARIEAACDGSGEITATLVITANDNVVQLTNLADGAHEGDPDADSGETFDLGLGQTADDATRQLVHRSAGVVSTASYGIIDGGGGDGWDCGLFGLVRTPDGTL